MKSLRLALLCLLMIVVVISLWADQHDCPCSDTGTKKKEYPCWQFADIMMIDGQERIVFPIEYNAFLGWMTNYFMIVAPFNAYNYQIKREHIIKAHEIIDKDLPLWVDSMKRDGITHLRILKYDKKKLRKQYASIMLRDRSTKDIRTDSIIAVSLSIPGKNDEKCEYLHYLKTYDSEHPQYNTLMVLYVNLSKGKIYQIRDFKDFK